MADVAIVCAWDELRWNADVGERKSGNEKIEKNQK